MLVFTCHTSDKHCEKMFRMKTDKETFLFFFKNHAVSPCDGTAAQAVPAVVPVSLCFTGKSNPQSLAKP